MVKPDGTKMHFDIIVPKTESVEEKVFSYGRKYLKQKGLDNLELNTSVCSFCHVENCSEEWLRQIQQQGFAIYEMEGCN